MKNLHEYPRKTFPVIYALPRSVIRLSVTRDPGKVSYTPAKAVTSAWVAADAALDAERFHHYRRMVQRCVVKFCSNSDKTGHSVYKFPGDPAIRIKTMGSFCQSETG